MNTQSVANDLRLLEAGILWRGRIEAEDISVLIERRRNWQLSGMWLLGKEGDELGRILATFFGRLKTRGITLEPGFFARLAGQQLPGGPAATALVEKVANFFARERAKPGVHFFGQKITPNGALVMAFLLFGGVLYGAEVATVGLVCMVLYLVFLTAWNVQICRDGVY